MSAWRRSLPAIRRNAAARLRVLLDRGERVVEEDRVALERRFSRLWAVSGGIGRHRYPALDSAAMIGVRRRDGPACATSRRPTSSAAMPPLDERLRARRADDGRARRRRRAAAEDRRPSRGPPARSPTRCRPTCAAPTRTARDDLVGMKWVAGLPRRTARAACPRSTASSLLTDPATGVPIAILDAGPITAERTAAVSGVAIARFAPRGRRAGRRGSRSSAPASRAAATSPVLGQVAARRSSSPSSTATRIGRRPSPTRPAATTGHRRRVAAATRPRGGRRRPTSSSPPRRSRRRPAPGR